jgi:hypothetical protein
MNTDRLEAAFDTDTISGRLMGAACLGTVAGVAGQLGLALLSAGMMACYVARAGAVAYHRQRSSPDRDRL